MPSVGFRRKSARYLPFVREVIWGWVLAMAFLWRKVYSLRRIGLYPAVVGWAVALLRFPARVAAAKVAYSPVNQTRCPSSPRMLAPLELCCLESLWAGRKWYWLLVHSTLQDHPRASLRPLLSTSVGDQLVLASAAAAVFFGLAVAQITRLSCPLPYLSAARAWRLFACLFRAGSTAKLRGVVPGICGLASP